MKLADLASKIEDMNHRQQEMDKTQAVYREHVSGMLDKILQQTTATNGKVTKNTSDIEANRKDRETAVKLLKQELDERVGPLENWRSRVGGVVLASLVAGSVLGTVITLAFSYIFKTH